VRQAIKHYLFRIEPAKTVTGFGGLFCHGPGSGSRHGRHRQDRSVTPERPVPRLLVFLGSRFGVSEPLPVERRSGKPDLLTCFYDRLLASPVRRTDNYRFARYEGEMGAINMPRVSGAFHRLPITAAAEAGGVNNGLSEIGPGFAFGVMDLYTAVGPSPTCVACDIPNVCGGTTGRSGMGSIALSDHPFRAAESPAGQRQANAERSADAVSRIVSTIDFRGHMPFLVSATRYAPKEARGPTLHRAIGPRFLYDRSAR
jgi:hypothetical protein